MNLTASQRRAVEHRGSSLLVAASAGSGKTEVLAQRCVSLLIDTRQPCDADRLLVVTFTRAAAAELRVRIARRLAELLATTRDSALRRLIRRQELRLDAAEIGTIDAWCGRLVRDQFERLGVDPDYEILGEQDAHVLRVGVLDELLDDIYRGGHALSEPVRAWRRRTARPDDEFLRQLTMALNRYREHLVNPAAWFEAQRDPRRRVPAEAVLATALRRECALQQAAVAAMLGQAEAASAAALRGYADALRDWCTRLEHGAALTGVVAEIAAFQLVAPAQRGGRTTARRGGGQPKRAAAADESAPTLLERVASEWLHGRLQEAWTPDDVDALLGDSERLALLVDTLLDVEAEYEARLGAWKRERARYEFGDVQRMALDVLGTPADGQQRAPTEHAHRLRARYEHVLVDECQDTSPIQLELLRLVTRAEPGRTNGFFVGDIKQSIYGFREAEPRLFARLLADYEAGRQEGTAAYLADNFRSHAGVLAPLNAIFARLFDAQLGGTAFGEGERLVARRTEIANPSLDGAPRIELLLLERPANGAPKASPADALPPTDVECEAQLVADRIRALLAGPVEIPRRVGGDGVELRPLRPADIAILLRVAQEKAGQVARVLRGNGLRCVAGGREMLLDSIDVSDVIGVLELLGNRRQDVALAAYLRGPLVELEPADLVRIRSACPQGDFLDAVEGYADSPDAEPALAARVRSACAQLDRWARQAREAPLSALVRAILRDGELVLRAQGLRGGPQRVALLRAVQRLAAQFDAGGQDAADFVAWLESLADCETDPGAPAPADEDAVRILTVHAAKGLEFPVVFVLDCGRPLGNRGTPPLHVDEELGIGLRFLDYPARRKLVSAAHHVAGQRIRSREQEEELRLLYVAATRAREQLYLVGTSEAGAWNEAIDRYANAGPQAPTLLERLTANAWLEWLLPAIAAARLHEARGLPLPAVRVTTQSAADVKLAEPAGKPDSVPVELPEWSDRDQAWVDAARTIIAAPPDLALACLPAVLSVSAAKRAMEPQQDEVEDRPATLAAPGVPLRLPRWRAEPAPTAGTDYGTAFHRFMQFADLRRIATLDDVTDQLAALRQRGRLSTDECALLDPADVAWLGSSEVGRLLATYNPDVRREVPFVFALPVPRHGERLVLRGVIDALAGTPSGLVIVDYKTDRVETEAELAQRIAGYTIQVQLYARAMGAILDRPVAEARLAFVRLRRLVPVACSPADVERAAERAIASVLSLSGDAPAGGP